MCAYVQATGLQYHLFYNNTTCLHIIITMSYIDNLKVVTMLMERGMKVKFSQAVDNDYTVEEVPCRASTT